MNKSFACTILPTLLALSACNPLEPCTLELRPGILLTVVDARSGGPVAGEVTATVTDGSYTETVEVPESGPGPRVAGLAFGRPGTYGVEVRSSGFRPWMERDVRVSENRCHVETVDLTARLEPAES
jgi:hypothetical protein